MFEALFFLAPAFCVLLLWFMQVEDHKNLLKTQRELDHAKRTHKTQLDDVYHQRNMLALALAKHTLELGLEAGIGIDPDEPSPDWRFVLYIDVPGGQLSYHLAPHEVAMFTDQLPSYSKRWDGSSKDQHHHLIEVL